MRRIREDHPDFELKRAKVYKARKRRPCDVYDCRRYVEQGENYALISTGIARCSDHFLPTDVVALQPRGSNG